MAPMECLLGTTLFRYKPDKVSKLWSLPAVIWQDVNLELEDNLDVHFFK